MSYDSLANVARDVLAAYDAYCQFWDENGVQRKVLGDYQVPGFEHRQVNWAVFDDLRAALEADHETAEWKFAEGTSGCEYDCMPHDDLDQRRHWTVPDWPDIDVENTDANSDDVG